MKASWFSDHFSGHACSYARFRPRYPAKLFEVLASLGNAHERAWDCGTGNGQAALGLAKHFDQVCATDASLQQLTHAIQLPRVSYYVAAERASGLPTASTDIVTAAQALHWFDCEAFYHEAKRVAKPGGVVAVWSYARPSVDRDVDALLDVFHDETVAPFWAPERRHVDNLYADLPFPFDLVPVPEMAIEVRLTMASFVAYVRTWSAVRRYIAQHGTDPVDDLERQIGLWWPANEKRLVRWPMGVRAGRVVKSNSC